MALSLDHVALPAFDAAGTLRFHSEKSAGPLSMRSPARTGGGSSWLMMLQDPNGHLFEITAPAGEASTGSNASAIARPRAWIQTR